MVAKTKKEIVAAHPENPYAEREGLVYARVSSKRQETEGSGLQSQEGRCVHDLHSIKVSHVQTFADSYSGGGDFMNRPAMREMLNYIDANPHRKFVVIFDDLSRFARDVEFHLKLRAAFKARDVLLRCLNYNLDDSPEGRFAETIVAASNELDRHKNRRQVIQKMKARLDLGYWPFRKKRGYDMPLHPLHGKFSVPNAEGLGIVKDALEAFATGNLARQIDVARFLVEREFWGRQSADKCITQTKALLQDCFYCGDIEYKSWGVVRHEGKHQGIITRETYALIQKRLMRDGVRGKVRKTASEDFPMRRLILCHCCGIVLTAAWSKGRSARYGYYYCQNKSCNLYSKMFRKSDVEEGFKSLLVRNEINPAIEKVLVTVFDRVWGQEMRNVEWNKSLTQERVVALRKKIHELAELSRKTSSDMVRREYEKEMETAAKEVEGLDAGARLHDDLDTPYRTALEKAVGLLKSPISIWENVNVYEKQRLFFFLFNEKLPYFPGEGYRTAYSLSTTRLFEELVTTNSTDVEMGGIEPPSESGRKFTSTMRS